RVHRPRRRSSALWIDYCRLLRGRSAYVRRECRERFQCSTLTQTVRPLSKDRPRFLSVCESSAVSRKQVGTKPDSVGNETVPLVGAANRLPGEVFGVDARRPSASARLSRSSRGQGSQGGYPRKSFLSHPSEPRPRKGA